MKRFKWKNSGFIFIYTGLLIIFFAALLGSSDLQRLKMAVPVKNIEWRATNEKNELIVLPFAIELKSFTIEEYPSTHKPKQFISDVVVYLSNGETKNSLIEVNKPLSIAGWKIYQHSYEKSLGKWSRYSVLLLVKDPWMPVVYLGICMIFVGAMFILVSGLMIKSKKSRMSTILTLFGIVLVLVFIERIWLSSERTQTLMPALQSPWFLPHVAVYMLAYSIFSVAVIYALFLLIKQKIIKIQILSLALCDKMAYVGTAFLTMGMLFGAVWAKEAWGHYWTWDPKETWALATWMAYLFYIHFRIYRPQKMKTAIYLLFFAFVILQICWIGVNYFPVLQGNSVHVYQ